MLPFSGFDVSRTGYGHMGDRDIRALKRIADKWRVVAALRQEPMVQFPNADVDGDESLPELAAPSKPED